MPPSTCITLHVDMSSCLKILPPLNTLLMLVARPAECINLREHVEHLMHSFPSPSSFAGGGN